MARSEGVGYLRIAATDRLWPDAGLIDIIKNHPAEVFSAVGSHFLNNELSSLLVLPVREELPEEAHISAKVQKSALKRL